MAVSGETRRILSKCQTTHNYCGVCGRTPKRLEEPNYAPIRWWDADDGWKAGSLCAWCFDMVRLDRPDPEDYAWDLRFEYLSQDPVTDEDMALVDFTVGLGWEAS